MSGTSADGVDVAIVKIDGRGLEMSARLLHHHHHPYEDSLRHAIFSMREHRIIELRELARCAREIAVSYADGVCEALKAADLRSTDLAAIAAHGQTLFHEPPDTIQWIDPALLAAKAGAPVISDFRRADCAAGGQGAPLVPFADYILFRHPARSRVLLNLGGIANITFIPAGSIAIDSMIAFDTGPGNCISDFLCREKVPGGPGYDLSGRAALVGTIIQPVVEQVMRHEYFSRRPPKSTDGPEMIAIFRQVVSGTGRDFPLADLLATACAITARSVKNQIPASDEVFAAGGGIENAALMRAFKEVGVETKPLNMLGIPPLAREAIAFALLGAATLDGIPSNVPSCTGARRAVVLGSVTPRP
jgi:anhydro-N-acetylmuramic acid kinase